MTVKVLFKYDGSIIELPEEQLRMEKPGILGLKLAPEKVSRFERQGDDLVLVLADGRQIVIQDFFVVVDDMRSDLVLLDDEGVLWWGQYQSPWSGFHFTEIEWDDGVPFLFGDAGTILPGWLLAGLAALGLGVAPRPSRCRSPSIRSTTRR